MRPVTRIVPPAVHQSVRELFTGRGHVPAKSPKNRYVAYEVRTQARSIFTLYTSGKLVASVRPEDGEGLLLDDELGRLLGSPTPRPAAPAAPSSGEAALQAGLDETGTGELIGSALVGGALFPAELAPAVAAVAGHVETKSKRAASGWERLGESLADLRGQGLVLVLQAIPNRLFDSYSKNALLDLGYVRATANLRAAAAAMGPVADDELHLAVDDYGAGRVLRSAVDGWAGRGMQVALQTKADDRFLAARVASVWARAARAREMAGLGADVTDGPLGSGNPGHAQTKAWLRRRVGAPGGWPSFVKASFRTVRDLDKLPPVEKQPVPSPTDLLGAAGARAFLAGRLDPSKTSLPDGSGGSLQRLLVDAAGRLDSRAPAAPFLSLLFGGLVLDLGSDDLEFLDGLLDREQGLASGWRVLTGPDLDLDDPIDRALLRAHRRGVVHLEPTTQAEPRERAARHAALLLTNGKGPAGLHLARAPGS